MATSTENPKGSIQGQGSDSARDVKLTLSLIIGSMVIIIGGGYWAWGFINAPPPAASRIDLTKVGTASTRTAPETPAYQALLFASNQQGAEDARNNNRSFIGSIPLSQEPIESLVPAAKPKVAVQPAQPRVSRSGGSQGGSSGTGRSDEKNAPLAELVKRIQKTPSASGIQVGEPLYAQASIAVGNSGSSRWSETLASSTRGQGSAFSQPGAESSTGLVPVEVVAPYWRGPGVIETGVDSDNSTTPVLASLPSGRYAGAFLKAPDGAKLSGDGVVIHFTSMAYKGINYTVDAYALDEESLRANVSTEVNNRYISRIVLPAVLSGIGSAGGMYSQANTQVVTNGFSTQTVRPGLPDGQAVVGAIVGGGASQAAKVLSEDAARVPAKQVTVAKGQIVAIQFMRGVYSGDAVVPGRNGEAVRPAVSVKGSQDLQASQLVSQDQWRLQAQERIRAQRQLEEGSNE